MSRILNRPMFRGGGRVDSRGTGIVANLEYRVPKAMGGMMMPMTMGYNMGGQVTPKRGLVDGPGGYAGIPAIATGSQLLQQTGAIIPQNIEEYRKQQQISTKPVLSLGEIDQQYRDYLNKLEQETKLPIDEEGNVDYQILMPEDMMAYEQKQKKVGEELDFYSKPEGEKAFKAPLLKQRENINLERQKVGLDPIISDEEKEEITRQKILAAEKDVEKNAEIKNTQSEFEQIFNEYLPIFQKQLGADPDEATRQRFLELAKFGTNLLAQGGGKRSLLEKIGAAGTPAIEGLSKIAKEEEKAKKYPKALALEAALKKVGDKKMTATEMSIVNDTIKRYAIALPFNPEENIKVAEEIVYNKKKLKDFKEHPGDTLTGKEEKGQYYYFKKSSPGLPRIAKWNGKQFIGPGEPGF